MFFSQDILKKRGGKFGIVWIAATKCRSVSLSKRDYFTVSISKTCDDIMKYICLKAEPVKHHGAHPRLSLYLSSQLMFGVAKVYEKQIDYFSADVRELYTRFSTAKLTVGNFEGADVIQTQLPKSYRTNEFCTLSDPLIDVQDPEFGALRFLTENRDLLPLANIDFLQDASQRYSSSYTSTDSSPHLRLDKITQRSPQTVSSASEISIREIPAEYLNVQIPDDTDLLALEDPVGNFMEEIQSASKDEMDMASELGLENLAHDLDRQRKDSSNVFGRIDIEIVNEFEPALHVTSGNSSTVQLHEQTQLIMPPEPVTPSLPISIPVLVLSPILAPSVIPSPVRRQGRRRQLLFSDFVDNITKLSKQHIRNNMATSNDLCHTLEEVLHVPSMTVVMAAKDLLALPGRESVRQNVTLMALWKSRAVPYKTSNMIAHGRDTWSTLYLNERQPKDTSSATDSSQVSLERVRNLDKEALDASPERLRDVSVESVSKRFPFEETPTTLTISDVSHLSESRDSIQLQPSNFQMESGAKRANRRLTEQSIEEEQVDAEENLLLGTTDDMPPLPEGNLEDFQQFTKSSDISTSEEEGGATSVPHPKVLRQIAELTAEDIVLTFKDLVPTSTSCCVAAQMFSVLLDYATYKLILIQQAYTYGDMYITRGLPL
ncbi:meiotic recombination protein REC8 homolog [Asterias amurensis]|uniref:meiotic recombination protein REC8 homolog n=1 Tax=Asterias amurensis TaxID=7602 RepID=UPI003AB21474